MQKLFYNGPVITMENAKPVEALLIEDDTIKAVGKLAEVEALAKDAERIDLKGRTLMPAFIDPHSHIRMAAQYYIEGSLVGAKNFDDIVEMIQNYIEENHIPPGVWVRANNYDHNFLAEKRHPDAAVLDRAAPNNPLMVWHKSGHMGSFNSLALKILNPPNREDAIPGGRIEIKDGKPSGYMEENAFFVHLMKVPTATAEEYLKGFEKAQEEYLANGITVIQEGASGDGDIEIINRLIETKMLKADVVFYPSIGRGEKAVEAALAAAEPEAHLRMGGYKMVLDGSPQGRTAWMRQPYLNSDGYCSYGTLSDEVVYNNIRKAVSENRQILAHCNGDAAAEQYISMIEKAEAEGYDVAKVRPVLIHGQLLGRDQLPRVKKAGIIPSFFVAHTWHWGDIHLKNFGAERANYISATGSALREGIIFTFHQDNPVIPPNMIETVWCAVNRVTKGGKQLSKDECISVFEALRAVTINAAYQYFEEDIRGTLKDGKKADFIILSENPLTYPPENLRDIKVLATFKNGENVWKA